MEISLQFKDIVLVVGYNHAAAVLLKTLASLDCNPNPNKFGVSRYNWPLALKGFQTKGVNQIFNDKMKKEVH